MTDETTFSLGVENCHGTATRPRGGGVTEELRDQLHAVDVITRVRDRLEAEGAMAELYRLRRFSVDELDLLVRLELGVECGHEDDWKKIGKKTGVFPAFPSDLHAFSPVFSPDAPQVPCETVAA